MNVVTTLKFFETWAAQHLARCGITRVALSAVMGNTETAVELSWPACGAKINGSVRDRNWPMAATFLTDMVQSLASGPGAAREE